MTIVLNVFVENDQLFVQPPGPRKSRLIPYGPDMFVVQGRYVYRSDIPITFRFSPNEKGIIEELEIFDIEKFRIKKIE